MRYALVFRNTTTRVALSIVLFIVVYFSGAYTINQLFNDHAVVTRKINVSNLVSIYIVETSAGATTPIIYYFYLIGVDQDASRFIAKDEKRKKSFLSTSDDNVIVEVKNTDVFMQVSGEIYQFDNRGTFKYQNSLYGIRISLQSKPR